MILQVGIGWCCKSQRCEATWISVLANLGEWNIFLGSFADSQLAFENLPGPKKKGSSSNHHCFRVSWNSMLGPQMTMGWIYPPTQQQWQNEGYIIILVVTVTVTRWETDPSYRGWIASLKNTNCVDMTTEQCKRKHGCLGYIRDEILPSYLGLWQTITRIPTKQPVPHEK